MYLFTISCLTLHHIIWKKIKLSIVYFLTAEKSSRGNRSGRALRVPWLNGFI